MTNFEKAKEIADQVLKENFVTTPPTPVVELTKNYGFEVVEIELPPDIAGFVNGENHLIFVNSSDPETRKAFTIAHELGHIKLHLPELEKDPDMGILYRQPLGKDDDDTREQEANYFAASLLVPESMYMDVLEKYKGLLNESNSADLLGKLFGVSPEVINYRLHDFNLEK